MSLTKVVSLFKRISLVLAGAAVFTVGGCSSIPGVDQLLQLVGSLIPGASA